MSKTHDTPSEDSIDTFATTAEVFVEPDETEVKVRKTPDDLVELSMRNSALNSVLLMEIGEACELIRELTEAVEE